MVPGPTGATGSTGTTGATGATGPTGSGGAGLSAYGSLSNDSGSVIAVVLGGTRVPVPNSQLLQNMTVNGGNDTITLSVTGHYRMSYCIRLQTPLLVSSRLVINGSPFGQSTISPTGSENIFCRSTISSRSAGDTVSMELFGLLGAAVLLNSGGAELVIEKLN